MDKIKAFLLENWFKVAGLLVILVIAILIYNAAVIQPRKERANIRWEEQLAETTRQNKIDSCLASARGVYDQNWNNSCKSLGKLSNKCERYLIDGELFSDVFPEYNDVDFAESVNAMRKKRKECSCLLPTSTANRWDEQHEKAKNACYSRYSS